MLTIAICENDIEDMNMLRQRIDQVIAQMPDLEVQCIYETESSLLLSRLQKGFRADAYFLDIVMPEINGMELGQHIRNMDSTVPIIFVTSSKEYAFDAFGIHAMDYLEKPAEPEKLERIFRLLYVLYTRKYYRELQIAARDGIAKINLNELMYVENISRSAVYFMKDGKKITGLCNRTAFEKSVSPVSEQDDFVQPHKSFFVNMQFIESLRSDQIILDNGKEIPVSHERATIVKKRYLKFLSGKGDCS